MKMNDVINQFEDSTDGYYHFSKDLENYPDAWCYVVWSRRGPGKTYSALWYHLYKNFPIIYMKRTVEDVDTIANGGISCNVDLSPYVPINRDKLTDIQPLSLAKGLGGFYHTDEEGNPVGDPVSYIMALNKVKSIKGFEASQCEWILLDEFIPQIGERTSAGAREGQLLLDLYMTVLRDRVKRGKGEVKLVLFANAEEISTPITCELEIVDDMAEMNANGERYRYLENKRIMLHHIEADEVPAVSMQDEKLGIYEAMKETNWGRKTFEGVFSNNDFSNIVNINLKGFKCLAQVNYRSHDYYIYLRERDGMFYMTDQKSNNVPTIYLLSMENDQKRFYQELWFCLRDACIDDRMKFKKYSMYDLLVNFKKFFKV